MAKGELFLPHRSAPFDEKTFVEDPSPAMQKILRVRRRAILMELKALEEVLGLERTRLTRAEVEAEIKRKRG